MNTLFAIVAGAIIGAGLIWYLFKKKSKVETVSSNSTVVLERIEKVFKVVLAEGFFSEIYDFKSEKWYMLDMINSTKKALIIAKAKTLVGFDFKKMKFSLDTNNKKFFIEEFPQPEVLSIDPEYKFYDAESGFFNKFNNEDYTNMIGEAKKRITETAMNSELPKVAIGQMNMLLGYLSQSLNWQIVLKQNGKEKLLNDENSKFLSIVNNFSHLTDKNISVIEKK